MTADSIRQFLSRRPFAPFRIVTSSGQSYDVRHPENAILYKSGLIVAYGGTNGLPEHYTDLSLLHIVALERSTGRRSTGSHRRQRRR